MKKEIPSAIKISMLAIVLSFGISYALAWTAPLSAPTTGNVAAPINTGSTDQTKTGDLCTSKGGTTKCLSAAQIAAPIFGFSVSPLVIQDKKTATLTWTAVSGATSCQIYDPYTYATSSASITGGTQTVGPINSGQANSPTASKSYTYTLTCTGTGGSTVQSALLNVLAPYTITYTNGAGGTVTAPSGVTLLTFTGHGGYGFQGGGCGDYNYTSTGGGGAAVAYSGATMIMELGGGGGAGPGVCPTGGAGGTTASGDGSGQGGYSPYGSGQAGNPSTHTGGKGGSYSGYGTVGGNGGVNGGYGTQGGSYTSCDAYGNCSTIPGAYGGGGGASTAGTGPYGTSGGTGYGYNAGAGGAGYGGGGGGSYLYTGGGGGAGYMAPGMNAPSGGSRTITLASLGLTAPSNITLYAGNDGVSYNGNRGPGASITLSW